MYHRPEIGRDGQYNTSQKYEYWCHRDVIRYIDVDGLVAYEPSCNDQPSVFIMWIVRSLFITPYEYGVIFPPKALLVM